MNLDDRWNKNFAASEHRNALKLKAVLYKGNACKLCKYSRCLSALVFHHENPKEKDFEISSKSSWNKAIMDELDKTILVCANCHAEIHAGWHPQYLCNEDYDPEIE